MTLSPDDYARPRPPAPVRLEERVCAGCGEAIVPGQLYAVAGPQHIYCRADGTGRPGLFSSLNGGLA